jgi:DNA (cytosine-5)-methyltransferase 1
LRCAGDRPRRLRKLAHDGFHVVALGTGQKIERVLSLSTSLDRPLRTLTTLDRFGLVQWIDGEPTLRMLQVPELKRAMGLTHLKDHRGEGVKFELEKGTRRDKIKVLGNGVCAPVMRAVVGSLIGGGASDLLEEDLRPRRSGKSVPRRRRKKPVRH